MEVELPRPCLRQRIREAIGDPRDLAADVNQSIFTWFLWDTFVNRSDEGAVTLETSSVRYILTDLHPQRWSTGSWSFRAKPRVTGWGASRGFCNEIGGLWPIAPYKRSSL